VAGSDKQKSNTASFRTILEMSSLSTKYYTNNSNVLETFIFAYKC